MGSFINSTYISWCLEETCLYREYIPPPQTAAQMARFSRNWLVASFFFILFQIGFALVFDEVPASDVVPSSLQTRASEDVDLSMLELLKKDSFYWTGRIAFILPVFH